MVMSDKNINLATEILVMAIVIFVILLFFGIGMLVLVHICIVGRAITRDPENNSATDRNTAGNTTISVNDLEKLPCYDYKARSKGSSPIDCAVCLDNLKVGEKCRLLPLCNHSFHAQCVDAWLLKTPICPICRATADSRRISPDVVGEESSHFSDTSADIRGSVTTESSHFSDASVELRRSYVTAGNSEVMRDSAIESEQNHTTVAGTDQLSSGPSLSLHSQSEPPV